VEVRRDGSVLGVLERRVDAQGQVRMVAVDASHGEFELVATR
jgi:hypothetical protein